jgi:hypothetical protein
MEVTPSSLTNEFISNKHALDAVFGKQFEYNVETTSKTTTLIGALKMLRSKPFGFNFIDVIQTYIELLRKDDRIDDNILKSLKNLITEFKDLLEPWVAAQTHGKGHATLSNEKDVPDTLALPVMTIRTLLSDDDRKKELSDRLATVLNDKCADKLAINTESKNPSQQFMHEMTKKLCDFFKQRTEESKKRPGFDINKEVHLGSALYSFLKYYDQLLLPILVNLRDENQTTEGKEFIKVFEPRIHAYIKGGKRTRHKRSDKRSGHKRSGKRSNKRSNKRSGNKRSGKRSGNKRSGKR